ncbi:type II toxin-antitoxin system RelE/ParE family toxin [Thalassotalea sp. LPB0316]|uniref:type II toxin-antitoxin system RelE/ParE family toxin n=1 Tax=Thalassotalea sp. LPB0316 TaxID=2769490 RepID=UPI001868E80B|nr:type II toxin-antitoxin system RelE/ParE family toxin [Thalassotalea sp. LPB0316]QOL24737.1 type II toxin-antitoxin system RelE/ParE family toxin [Thalassotalea sp. LPB0316]
MANYILSNKADSDLAEIYEYGVLNFGKEQASNYLIGLHDKFELIIQNKFIGLSADEISLGLKRALHNSHVIFYQEQDANILIVRVLRSEMDFERHLY